MAKNQNEKEGKKEFSTADKVKYFEKRKDDVSLSDGQRRYAANRYADLTGGKRDTANTVNQRQARNGNYGKGTEMYTVMVTKLNNNFGGKR